MQTYAPYNVASISKVKEQQNIFQINEIITHLRISGNTWEYDRASGTTEEVIREAENYINADIIPTENTTTIRNFYGSKLEIDEGYLISLSSITYFNGSVETEITDYFLQSFHNLFRIFFPSNLVCDRLVIKYRTGFEVCPLDLKKAIKVGIADAFDVDMSSYTLSSYKYTEKFHKLLDAYKIQRF